MLKKINWNSSDQNKKWIEINFFHIYNQNKQTNKKIN